LYLGTFSKILSPGIRLGWVVAPAPVLTKIKLGKQATDLCTSSLTQQLVERYFAQGTWRAYVHDLCSLYRRRRDAMLDALAEFFPPQAEWTQPGGGLFIWVTLPDFIDTEDLLAKALQEQNVAFVPGSAAYVDGRGGSSMRLNFSAASEDEIVEGIRRIGKVVDEQISLFGTLSGQATIGERGGRPSGRSATLTRGGRTDESAEVADEDLADVVELPRRTGERRGAQGS
jgi:2-aminoadipate transaminase